MHIVVSQAVLCEGIEVGSITGSAEATDLPEAHVIENDEQNIGRAFFSPQRLRPRGLRYIKGSPDHAGKCGSRFVFFKRHFHFPPIMVRLFIYFSEREEFFRLLHFYEKAASRLLDLSPIGSNQELGRTSEI
jgi:hypothetical protein